MDQLMDIRETDEASTSQTIINNVLRDSPDFLIVPMTTFVMVKIDCLTDAFTSPFDLYKILRRLKSVYPSAELKVYGATEDRSAIGAGTLTFSDPMKPWIQETWDSLE